MFLIWKTESRLIIIFFIWNHLFMWVLEIFRFKNHWTCNVDSLAIVAIRISIQRGSIHNYSCFFFLVVWTNFDCQLLQRTCLYNLFNHFWAFLRHKIHCWRLHLPLNHFSWCELLGWSVSLHLLLPNNWRFRRRDSLHLLLIHFWPWAFNGSDGTCLLIYKNFVFLSHKLGRKWKGLHHKLSSIPLLRCLRRLRCLVSLLKKIYWGVRWRTIRGLLLLFDKLSTR